MAIAEQFTADDPAPSTPPARAHLVALPTPPVTVAVPTPDASTDARFDALAPAGVIDAAQLAGAKDIRRRSGGDLLTILTSSGGVSPVSLARGLAAGAGLAYVPLERVTVSDEVAGAVDETTAIRHRFVPIAVHQGRTWIAVADPGAAGLRTEIRRHIAGPVRLTVASAAEIYELLGRAHGTENVRRATLELMQARPEDSAAEVMTRRQQLVIVTILLTSAFFIGYAPIPALVVINALAAFCYEATAIFRLRLVALATGQRGRNRYRYEAIDEIDERQLPIYSILVPLYREAAVVPRVTRSLAALDYPAHKLDVMLVCEADDDETIDAIRRLQLGSQFRLVVVPDAQPKTKPKACNYALAHALGEMVVIFDAEDEPEPDQLKQVLLTLRDAPPQVVCIQAKLDYANATQNWLTRWFTAEYALWFDLILPGLQRFDAPIPLGGTSNHFRTHVLRELGGWDPFNVTEDADLGVRLYKRGYKTLIVDSTTFEEANSQVGNWIRQRSRWIKGHMQTWLVHTRHPIRMQRELGRQGALAFHLTIGGSCFAALLNPIYWALVVIWFVTSAGAIRATFPSFVYYAAAGNLLVWNFGFIYMAAAGVSRRGYFGLVRSILTSPLYWVLISVAAWKGALQLITKPFYWEKTVHGLDEPSVEPPPGRRR